MTRIVWVALLLLLALPGSAAADAIVERSGDRVTYRETSAGDDKVDVSVEGPNLRFSSTVALATGNGCQPASGDDVVCESGSAPTRFNLGSGNDGVTPAGGSNFAIGFEVYGDVGSDTITGTEENDLLEGGADGDTLNGGAGDDQIRSRDGAVDTVDCGAGADTVTADGSDTVTGCETVVVDDDGDGALREQDCDDRDPSRRPGATEVPGNGKDEDCNGVDARPDRDGDGFVDTQDCNDSNAAIRPGAPEIPGNDVDEDCDGVKDPGRVTNSVANRWLAANRTQVLRLAVRALPRGYRVEVRCTHRRQRSCPFRVRRARIVSGAANLKPYFKKRRLRAGTIVEVRIVAPGNMVSKVVRYTIRRLQLPTARTLCLPPGATTPRRC